MNQPIKPDHSSVIKRTLFVVVGMFGFGFAMVPLYNVFCDVTGLNGKVRNEAAEAAVYVVDEDRTVLIEFVATVNGDSKWNFRPTVGRMRVHPGKMYTTTFVAENLSSELKVAQAVPSVTPGLTKNYFIKTECFCFTQQQFAGQEVKNMPVTFVVDPAMPAEYEVVTLSYTFFDVPGSS